MEKDGTKKKATAEVEQDHHQRCHGDEERKIEKFFAIIERLREARASAANSLDELAGSVKHAKKARVHGPVWTPVFELEDFAGPEKNDNAGTSTRRPPGNGTAEGKEKEGEEKGLDLNLTL